MLEELAALQETPPNNERAHAACVRKNQACRSNDTQASCFRS